MVADQMRIRHEVLAAQRAAKAARQVQADAQALRPSLTG
jgi:hypothetical protein